MGQSRQNSELDTLSLLYQDVKYIKKEIETHNGLFNRWKERHEELHTRSREESLREKEVNRQFRIQAMMLFKMSYVLLGMIIIPLAINYISSLF